MNRKITIAVAILAFAIAAVSCSKPATQTKAAANTNTAAKPAAPATSKPGEAKLTKPGEKAPEASKMLPADKKVPVPQDWETYYDEAKGYQFEVPAGTESKSETVNGVDVFAATLPPPAKIAVMVVAFKNQKLTKDDLLETVKRILSGMGEKDIKIGAVKELSDDYDLVEVSSVDEKGETTKAKVLIATDVTDNYLVLVGSPQAEFAANEKIIDAIWGSFGMYSGGASGQS